MIYYTIPWDTSKNIGKYYNAFMRLLPSDNDFACFVDGDACFTTQFFGKQLEDIVNLYPECSCFTSMANRIGCKWQQQFDQNSAEWLNNDMAFHRAKGKEIQFKHYATIADVSDVPRGEVLGGVLILIKKSLWKKIGGFKETGMLGIDNDLHWKCMDAGEKVYLMKGVYLYHWYRGGDMSDKQHLL